jgi:hypothetical protein
MELPAVSAAATPATAASTTSASVAPASAAVTTAASTSTAATLGFGPGLINIQGASADLLPVQRSDGFVTLFGICHLDKAKAAGTASVAVGHDADPVHLSIGFKQLTEVFLRSVEIQISDEDILHGRASN